MFSSVGGISVKLERLDYNTLKIFLTLDDLYENGLTVEEIKENRLKVHAIIQNMVENACAEVDFQMFGTIQIEIFSLHTQGLIMIVKREDDANDYDDLMDLQVYLEEQRQILYVFEDFEDIVQVCIVLKNNNFIPHSTIYFYNDFYYLHIYNLEAEKYEVATSLVAEFGFVSTMSLFYLAEYGKKIMEKNAIFDINHFFNRNLS